MRKGTHTADQPIPTAPEQEFPFMKVSVQGRIDTVSMVLTVIVSLSLAHVLTSDSMIWWRNGVKWIWLEFIMLLFFMRPLFCVAETPSRWGGFSRSLGRSLGILVLSVLPVLAACYWIPPGRSDFLGEIHLWLTLPCVVGCGAFATGYLMRLISEKIGC
jgi:hypothetical protein